MDNHFQSFEKLLFSGEFFIFNNGFPEELRAPDSVQQRLIISFLDVLYGVQPILAYEQMKQLLFDQIVTDDALPDKFVIKAKILYILSYGYVFQENEPTQIIDKYLEELDLKTETDDRWMDHWYILFLGQKMWLKKFDDDRNTAIYDKAVQLAIKHGNKFLHTYIDLINTYAYVLIRDLDTVRNNLDDINVRLEKYNNDWLRYNYFLINSLYYYHKGKYQQSIKHAIFGLAIGGNYQYSMLENVMGLFKLSAGPTKIKVAEVVEYLQKRYEEYFDIDYNLGKAILLGTMADIYYNIKFYSNYITYTKEQLKIIEKHGFVELAIKRYYRLGTYYLSIKNDSQLARKYYSKALEIAKEEGIENSFLLNFGNTGFAQYHEFKGELNIAIDYYTKAISTPEAFANYNIRALSEQGIAKNLTNQGDFSKAHQTLQKASTLFYKLRHIQFESWIQSILDTAIIETKIGKRDNARHLLDQTIELSQDPHHPTSKIIGIRARYERFKLILTTDKDSIEEEYQKLEKYLQQHTDLRPVMHYLKLIKALKLKQQHRLEHKIEALLLLRELTDVDLQYDLRVEIYLSLIEILGMEYKLQQHPDVREEIMEQLDKFYGLSTGGINFFVIVYYLILNSKVELIDLKFNAANVLLENAASICEKYQLNHLSEVVEEEKRELSKFLTSWDESLQSNQSLLEKIKGSHLDSYIRKMLNISQE